MITINEALTLEDGLPTEEQERLASWLRWAREYADRIDPLIGDAWQGSSSLKKS
jgi:hypothetical protein